MFVLKRDGRKEPVHFGKVTSRIKKLCYGLSKFVDPVMVAQKVCTGVYKGVSTVELDELAAETAAHLTSEHPDYGLLAARIAVSNLHKETKKSFFETCEVLYEYNHATTGVKTPLLSEKVYKFVKENQESLQSVIVYDRDFTYDYFGFKTLERSYLLKVDGKIVERPQHMLMRVACGIHCGDVVSVLKSYELMSKGLFTHASPTLFNSGTPQPQLSSCFLLTIKSDSIEGIFNTLKNCAIISKSAGGIGLSAHKVRALGSYIAGTNGVSNGLVPMLRVFNNAARYVDQGGGKRKGAFAVYLEPWHADIFRFLELRKNHGKFPFVPPSVVQSKNCFCLVLGAEEARARDLFFGLWIPDLFMQRVEANAKWSLFCPHECPGLPDCWGDEFVRLYTRYEADGKAREQVDARKLWHSILEAQIETGTPYMLYKDACNAKSNQQNLGTIRSSNLCTEIIEYTAPDEVAVCNLASLALPRFVMTNEKGKLFFDHKMFAEVVQVVTRNLNKIIDINYYPLPEAKKSNLRHRPIGIGVQGLADVFMLLKLPYESKAAQKLNQDIFETIYYAALTASNKLAKEEGVYESFPGSPVSKGRLQFDLWGVTPTSGNWDWKALKAEIKKSGLRNSLLVAPMPTASTSQILGNNECFEPYTSNIYVRRTLAGEFVLVNKHLLRELTEMGIWTPKLKNTIIAANGSVQGLSEIPSELQQRYKTAWEMSGRTLLEMAAARGAFIDQSQSFNVHMRNVTYAKLTSLHFAAWKKGLKTGMYYLRTQAATDAIKFTLDQEFLDIKDPLKQKLSKDEGKKRRLPESNPNLNERQKELSPPETSAPSVSTEGIDSWRRKRQKTKEVMACALNNKEGCDSCGS